MKTKLITFILVLLSLISRADEGMWLPIFLSQLNEKEMQGMGLKITAEDIYSINKSSLKDAIVLFGGGCTGELVSNQGLLLTNHHCGYGNIQKHSSLQNDYLTNGFWAQSFAEELPNPGLSVTFLISMEDVTNKILAGTKLQMGESMRDSIIDLNMSNLIKNTIVEKGHKASVKPFYSGNQYFLFITETFNDVRLVGAPPSNIGKFGGDTDNWMWPRHTGDFSIFRIYADKNNKPAEYSKDNVPYKPAKSLQISIKGVNENDFTFVYGFPGTTQEYLPSYAVNQIANERNPIAISMRENRLNIINDAMESDRLTRIQYSAKAAGIANGWKKMIGESKGIKKLDGVAKKQLFEASFTDWAQTNSTEYSSLLPEYARLYQFYTPTLNAYTYLTEGLLGIELLRFSGGYIKLISQSNNKDISDTDIEKLKNQFLSSAIAFYKNYNPTVDKKLFAEMVSQYIKGCDADKQPNSLREANQKYGFNTNKWADELYAKSIFSDSTKLYNLLKKFKRKDAKLFSKDPVYRLSTSIYEYAQQTLSPVLADFYAQTDSLQRIYMAAQMQMQPNKRFYPDANSTLRISYGKVKGFSPADGVYYNWFTTLDGIMQKENPDIYDYVVEPKLKQLYVTKNYGRYADADGSMHVAFIASNHTTGGNSGSPVLNAEGHLIGINFDRCWEGTMSDLMYNPDICRNISLDIRYCLFIIDKMAGANRLIDEMNIVE